MSTRNREESATPGGSCGKKTELCIITAVIVVCTGRSFYVKFFSSVSLFPYKAGIWLCELFVPRVYVVN